MKIRNFYLREKRGKKAYQYSGDFFLFYLLMVCNDMELVNDDIAPFYAGLC